MNENISQFTKQNVRDLQAEARALLAPLEAKYGLQVLIAGGTYETGEAKLRFAFVPTSPEAERLLFVKDAPLFMCDLAAYGRVATINRQEVTLVGFQFKKKAFPVKCRLADGKVMLYREDVLHRFFHTGAPAAPTFSTAVARA